MNRFRPWRFFLTPILCALAGLLTPRPAAALGPHEVLLLVNRNSPLSLECANLYAHLRGIPAANIVFLDLPAEAATGAKAELSPADFITYIWDPATRAVRERNLESQILAWAYSADFPVRVTGTPALSLHGFTFTRARSANDDQVKTGRYGSLLFRGPARADESGAPPLSLDRFAPSAGTNMPLPAMSIAYAGARGLDRTALLALLQRAAAADAVRPRGTVFFLNNDDVRAQARAWQFPLARAEAAALGFDARTVTNLPPKPAAVAGIMAGAAHVNLAPAVAPSFVPGAAADHLTSWAAEFHNPSQTKLTAWINAGACGAAGTVVEPYAMWTKFPHARFFTHYGSGCTLLEAYAQSVAAPFQLYLLGDPLCAPWKPPFRIDLLPPADEDAARPGRTVVRTRILPEDARPHVDVQFFLDGAPLAAAEPGAVALDTAALPEGWHELRAVAALRTPIRHQVFTTGRFEVYRRNRRAVLDLAPNTTLPLHRPLRIKVRAEGGAQAVELWHGLDRLADAPGADAAFELDPARVGAGPVLLEAAAVYADGARVRGAAIPVLFADTNAAPVIADIAVAQDAGAARTLTPQAQDVEADPLRFEWFASWTALPAPGGRFADGFEPHGARMEQTDAGLLLTPGAATGPTEAAALPETAGLQAVRAELCLTPGGAATASKGFAGLAVDIRDPREFLYFGLDPALSAWVLGVRSARGDTLLASRGVPSLAANRWYTLELRRTPDGALEGLVDGRPVLRAPSPPESAPALGRAGLAVRTLPATFRAFRRRLEPGPGIELPAGGRLVLAAGAPPPPDGTLLLRVTDAGGAFAEREVKVE